MTLNMVMVESISAARFHMTQVKLNASTAPPISAVRSPFLAAAARRPAINAMMAMSPEATGTVRACHVPTPNVRNAAYSAAVITGAMKTGVQ